MARVRATERDSSHGGGRKPPAIRWRVEGLAQSSHMNFFQTTFVGLLYCQGHTIASKSAILDVNLLQMIPALSRPTQVSICAQSKSVTVLTR